MKLLLTGATGFVGRNLLLELLREKKYETIYTPVRSAEKLKEQLKQEGISECPKQIEVLPMEAPSWDFSRLIDVNHVVHGAGVLFGNSLEDYSRTNTDGTMALLKTLPASDKTIILSSQAASGPCGETKLFKTELEQDSPVTWYGASKLQMEQRVQKEFSERGIIFLRPPMILGPRDTATLPLFKMAKGWVQFKPGFREKYYSFVAVQDLVKAILAALESPQDFRDLDQRKFFVASNKAITDLDLISTAAKVMNREDRILRVPQPLIWGVSQIVGNIPSLSKAIPNLSKDRAKEIWPNRWVVSCQKFESQFGWSAQVDLTTTLRETFDWYVKSGQLSSV
jgi:nucleoside-diphosphate-sugar epimerase